MSLCSVGLWKIVARFSNNIHHIFSTVFEVKDYGASLAMCTVWMLITLSLKLPDVIFLISVLPSFEVKLTPQMKFLYVDSEQLTVRVDAMYVKLLLSCISKASEMWHKPPPSLSHLTNAKSTWGQRGGAVAWEHVGPVKLLRNCNKMQLLCYFLEEQKLSGSFWNLKNAKVKWQCPEMEMLTTGWLAEGGQYLHIG